MARHVHDLVVGNLRAVQEEDLPDPPLQCIHRQVVVRLDQRDLISLRVFDQVYVLVKGGGLNEDAARTVMYQAVTTAFDQNNIGQASAITVVFFLIVVVLTLIQRRVVRPDNED